MTVVSPPTNVGLCLRINEGDGSLSPTGDIGTAGTAGLGMKIVCVTNMGGDAQQPTGTTIQYLYANCGFSLPYARYAVDWGALKANVNAGKAYTANTFSRLRAYLPAS